MNAARRKRNTRSMQSLRTNNRAGIAIAIRALLTVAFASAASAALAIRPPQSNIVHILIDDLGWQDVACYYRGQHDEEAFYETPNIDRIAQRGVRFTQAYSPAMTCAPSRAAYLSGQYTPRNGVYHVNMGCQIPRLRRDSNPMLDPYYVGRLMPDKPSLGKAMKDAGYTTAHIGKWHVAGPSGYPAPIDVGFDFSFDRNKRYNDPEIYDEEDLKLTNFSGLFAQPKHRLENAFDDPRFPLLEDDRPYDSMTDLSQRWIRKIAQAEKPFFLNLCPNLVHGPVMTRDQKRLRHYCKKLGIPFPTDQGSISKPEKPGHHNPYYASMVDSVDWIVGQVIQTLEATEDRRYPGHKLIDNTYVFISSDNGGAQQLRNWKSAEGKIEFEKVTDNAPLREGKAWAYEGGCRIPFLVMGPDIKPNQVNQRSIINLIDLYPTFLAIADNPINQDKLDGCNLLPLLKGEQEQPHFADGKTRDNIFFHYPVLNAAFSTVRRGPWKLLKNTGGPLNPADEVQLFHLYNQDGSEKDISENKNLAEANPKIAAELLNELNGWLKKNDAGLPYKNPNYKSGNLPGQNKVPKVIRRESSGSKLSVWLEAEKSNIIEAFLLYTINPGKEEEWFRTSAKINGNRITTQAPPGMTHGVFCLIDENRFLITSEPIPSMQKLRLGQPVSASLRDGFAFRPGLFALIELAKRAETQAEPQRETEDLREGIRTAEQLTRHPVSPDHYISVIRDLRKTLRSLNLPASKHPALNWFPQTLTH